MKIFKNSEGKRVTLSYHSKKMLHPKLLRTILSDVRISVEEFKKLLWSISSKLIPFLKITTKISRMINPKLEAISNPDIQRIGIEWF